MTSTGSAPQPTITSTDQCTLDTCPLSEGDTHYLPNLGGNSFFIAVFALFIPVQLFLGIRHRTWGFLFGTICGLILEIIGYVGRLKIRDNPFIDEWFLMYVLASPALYTLVHCFSIGA